MTSDADLSLLLIIARESLAAPRDSLSHPHPLTPHLRTVAPVLLQAAVAFVTLSHAGASVRLLGHSAERAAWQGRAALRGRRREQRSVCFPAIISSELDAIHIEISLLGPLETIAGPQDIVIA